VLHEWRGFPGRGADGAIDADALRVWVVAARESLRQSGHDEIGDQKVGEVLARVRGGDSEMWPPACVRELIEDFSSESLEEGFYLGVVNGREVTVRSPYDGGEQEVALADRYARLAESASATPRVARVLRMLSDRYRGDARREDERRDLNEFWR
jgi:hypothetical protein